MPKKLTKEDIQNIFDSFAKNGPTPRIELEYVNAYTLLVATVLSAQSTDKGVNKATKELFKKVQQPSDMVELGLDNLKEYIKTIGLYNNKAKNLIRLSEQLLENHNGEVPSQREDLEALAGVGRKSANVILNVIFDQPTLAVDTHVFRVSQRIGLAKGKTPLEIEKQLLPIIPPAYKMQAHHWLVLHGRYICKAKKPECQECLIAWWCQKNGVSE